MGVPFLYLYVIASRLGEEAAILEGILLERFETLLSPILGLRLVLGEFLQQGLGRLPGELRSGWVFQQLLQQVRRSCFEAAYSRTPGASPPAPAGPSAPPP